MQPNHLNLLLAILGIVASVLLSTASSLVAGIAFGTVLGIFAAPHVGRASAWLARYLGQ
jgi:hypothetical protein